MRYAVLHGQRSGRRGNTSLVARVGTALRDHGHAVAELAASSVEEARASAQLAVENGFDVLVVVGGDGVVRIAAQACARRDTAIAIIPAGSGNDTARSLGIATKHVAAINVAAAGHRRTIDLIAVRTGSNESGDSTYIVGSLPAALDARIAARSQRVPALLGGARYAVATVAEIPRLRAANYQLRIDGRAREHSALVLTVCNLPIFGGGMRIAPAANPADGLMDVVIIDTIGPLAAVGLLRAVYAGTHAEHPAVQIVQCESVTIEGPDLLAYGDGDPVGPLPLHCEIVKGALQVVVPADV
ncbi:MAG: diacylglycerol kinase family protein [Ornithinimicrobium sp.]